MKSDRLEFWVSMVANVAILTGLLLVFFELRHNTLATQADLHLQFLNYGRDHAELLVGDENEKLADIVFRGETDPDALTPIEMEKFLLFTAWRMGAWETTFINHDEGLLGGRHFEAANAWYAGLLRRGPGYRVWWESSRHGYDQGFKQHVDHAFEATVSR
jgi:hypothetical protein